MNTVTQLYRCAGISPAHVYYPDGSMRSHGGTLHTNLVALLTGTLGRFAPCSTIVIDGAAPDDMRALPHGWALAGSAGPWRTYRHAELGRTVAVGYRDEMTPRHFGVMYDAKSDLGALTVMVDRYNRLVPTAWRGTCSTSSLNALRATWGNTHRQPRWKQPKLDTGHAGPLIWRRELTPLEASWGWVHTFDANSAYLGEAINAELAWSELEHTGSIAFDARMPGYWLIAPSIPSSWDGPPLLGKQAKGGGWWVTTPYAKLFVQLGFPFVVIDSWTGRGQQGRAPSHRVMRMWAESLRDALRAVETAGAPGTRETMRFALKRTYKDTMGALQRPSALVSRPDWAHTIIDGWRATLIRTAVKVRARQGVWPVAVNVDSLTYADCVPEGSPILGALGKRESIHEPKFLGLWKESGLPETADNWTKRHAPKVRRAA